jgi:large subunit ribosomal protein L3
MSSVEKGLIAKKIGMTSIFDADGKMIPVTVLEAGPCKVLQRKTEENDGYQAVQLGFIAKPIGKANKPQSGHLKKIDSKNDYKVVSEIRVANDSTYYEQEDVTVEIFQENDIVKVAGITKGRGFTGPVKRHGFSIGPMAHGSKNHRRVGSIGAGTSPGKVWKGQKMPGHYGAEQRTQQGLKVVKVDVENNLLLVKGSVPGPNDSIVKVQR